MVPQIIAAFMTLMAWQNASSPNEFPTVTVKIPADVPFESVMISYDMIGPFGGHGTAFEHYPGQDSIKISAHADNRAAENIKLAVYAAGCEFQTFDFNLIREAHPTARFECRPVNWVSLSGQIKPVELLRNKKTQIVFLYTAFWTDDFYDIKESWDFPIQLAQATPDADGKFHAELPYFTGLASPDPTKLTEGLRLELLDAATGSTIAFNLKPENPDFVSEIGELQFRKSYPENLIFTPDRDEKAAP